ncbi:MAG: hypothetical protein GDA52_09820 [Rhodobacteraceae bacterium]|nr:hypothetical protein [Paracoccaceae bacterium]
MRDLIDAGADITARDKAGQTPAGLAELNAAVHDDPVFLELDQARYNRPVAGAPTARAGSPPAAGPQQISAVLAPARPSVPACRQVSGRIKLEE